ncbi:ribulose-phosphate 3-epimerase [Candidatus Dependentiae bacterium]|nr:MAG: ribulose-phosphate 3-epimerase [Candidatus Dependentiae bacterium]
MAVIYPSLIAADLLNLQEEIKKLDPYCQGYHLDIMDNHFVPNLTFGSAFVNAIAQVTYKKIWVQLLVDKPENWIDQFFLPIDSIITFHIESSQEIRRTIDHIKKKKWLPSIAINPKTEVEILFPYLDRLSQVLIMSVVPGFSGQEFLPDVISKVDRLVSYRQTSGLPFVISMDGGINKNNIRMLKEHGVDIFAVGSGIFKSEDPVATLKELNTLIA